MTDLPSHVSLVRMKYNRLQLASVKISTKIKAAMLSIMILSTNTDNGLKQVLNGSNDDSGSRV